MAVDRQSRHRRRCQPVQPLTRVIASQGEDLVQTQTLYPVRVPGRVPPAAQYAAVVERLHLATGRHVNGPIRRPPTRRPVRLDPVYDPVDLAVDARRLDELVDGLFRVGLVDQSHVFVHRIEDRLIRHSEQPRRQPTDGLGNVGDRRVGVEAFLVDLADVGINKQVGFLDDRPQTGQPVVTARDVPAAGGTYVTGDGHLVRRRTQCRLSVSRSHQPSALSFQPCCHVALLPSSLWPSA